MQRIKGSQFEKDDLYNDTWRPQVEEALRLSSATEEIVRLLGRIRKNALSLKSIILSEEEQTESRSELETFDKRMKSMVVTTFKNLDQYQLSGWKELLNDGEEP